MSLEQKYENAEANEQAIVQRIRAACATWMQSRPDFLPSERNEQIMFAAMESPSNDHLRPTRAADWDEVFLQVRDRLEQRTVRTRAPQIASRLTADEVESWSAEKMAREMDNPRRAAEIENVLSQ
jgi:hypothetical protein